MFYELAAPNWGPEELEAIARVLNSGQLTMAGEVRRFEECFAKFHGCRYAVMVNSGSSANLVAVAALFYKKHRPLRAGDEVIVPAISWATTYHPLQQYGLKLRFLDVELDSVNMDVSQLEAALTPRTRAIMIVSILGNPARLDVIRAFADRHGLYLIEDNCESLGARLPGGRLTGTFGELNTFSFFYSHHISTMEGGMVLTDDEEFFHLVRSLRAHGWTRDLPADSPIVEKRTDDFFEAYRFILPGYNVRPLEMSGAVGVEQLKKLPAAIAQRRRNLALFEDLFGNDERFFIQRQYGESSSFCFPIVLASSDREDRKRVLAALRAVDVGYRIVTGGCFVRHDVVRHYDYDCVGDLPNANRIHDFGFFIGNHPRDLTREIETAHGAIVGALARPLATRRRAR
jgi:CDP-4-dehydro-6-deoxyglucose reductase, E1